MSQNKKIILGIFLVFFLLAFGLWGVFFYFQNVRKASPPAQKPAAQSTTVTGAQPKEKSSAAQQSIGLTPQQLVNKLADGSGWVHLSGYKEGKDDKGNDTISYDYEDAGMVKVVLERGMIHELTSLCKYGGGSEGATLQLARLTLGLISATNPEVPEERVKKMVTDLLIKAEKRPGKMQKLVVGNIKYGASVLPRQKMVLFVVIPATDKWPSEKARSKKK